MCGATGLPADFCVIEQVIQACWSSTKRTSSSSHRIQQILAEILHNLPIGVKNPSPTHPYTIGFVQVRFTPYIPKMK